MQNVKHHESKLFRIRHSKQHESHDFFWGG